MTAVNLNLVLAAKSEVDALVPMVESWVEYAEGRVSKLNLGDRFHLSEVRDWVSRLKRAEQALHEAYYEGT